MDQCPAMAKVLLRVVSRETQVDLHRSAAIAGSLEGGHRVGDGEDAAHERPEVDPPRVDEIDRERELLVKAERPLHLDLLGHDQVLRDRNVASKPKLNQHGAGLERLQAGAYGALNARSLKLNIEGALVGRIRRQR